MARVLVPLADGCEELEAVTIIDLLVRAGAEVTSASLKEGPVKASRGVTLLADTTLEQALQQDYDMLVLPGGMPGTQYLEEDPRILKLIQQMAGEGRHVCAVCAAPRVLGKAGVLQGKKATSYPGHLDKMALPGVQYVEDAVVTDGKVVTSRGPGTAIPFALTLIEQLFGTDKRHQVAQGLLFPD